MKRGSYTFNFYEPQLNGICKKREESRVVLFEVRKNVIHFLLAQGCSFRDKRQLLKVQTLI